MNRHLCTALAIASGHRPRVARRLLAVHWATQPFVLGNTSTPHPRRSTTLEHYLTPCDCIDCSIAGEPTH